MLKNRIRTYALISGYSLLLMAILAGFSYGYVYNNAMEVGDPIQTAKWIKEYSYLFKLGISGWVLILILDIIVSLSLHQFFKQKQLIRSTFTAGLRLLYSAFLGVAIFYLIQTLHSQLNPAQIFQSILLFNKWWTLGLMVFGIHLIGLGTTGCYSGLVPKFWCGLLVFAGCCYLGINGGKWLLPELLWLNQAETFLSLPMAISELGLALWLIYKGGRLQAKHN